MNDAKFKELIKEITAQGELTEAGLLTLRRATSHDFDISPVEADALFVINDTMTTPNGWREYFINAITHFLVSQTVPKGYVTDAKASWLIARIAQDGEVCTETEIGILMSVLKTAQNVTERLEKFALDLVKAAVISGDGYWGQGRALQAGVIGEAEVNLLQTVLYAVSSDTGASISQMEAEALFDLNERCQSEKNHPSWQRLFVGAIANHLMALSAWEEPTANEALRREKWLEDTSPVGMLNLGNIAKSFSAWREQLQSEKVTAIHMNHKAVANAERIIQTEASWLIDRLNRDGTIDANERALLDFLAQECPDIHASLKPLIRAA
ncbi:hypothetical protein [Fretibacter rubidus]|uniref:hypothetical protein n=1 Tax=Fretibacter rubidus TaxID=570162 RepID=UPI00352AD4F2